MDFFNFRVKLKLGKRWLGPLGNYVIYPQRGKANNFFLIKEGTKGFYFLPKFQKVFGPSFWNRGGN